MENCIYEPQDKKDLSKCETAYIFKGLGLNLIPRSPDENELQKMRVLIKDLLLNNGKNNGDNIVDKVVGKNPKIGLNISLMQRKFIEALTIVIGNSTLMTTIQKNKFYKKNNCEYKITNIDYKNLQFKVLIKDINKLFGRSITEKMGKNKKNIVEQLFTQKCFLKNHKGEFYYGKPLFATINDKYLIFSFASFIIGATYDYRKNFFKNIRTNYEAIFFENLFDLTKDYKKKNIEHFCFTTRSLLKKLDMDTYATFHKQKVIRILNKCFIIGKNIGLFAETFQYTKDSFNRNDTTHFNIPINKDFKWNE